MSGRQGQVCARIRGLAFGTPCRNVVELHLILGPHNKSKLWQVDGSRGAPAQNQLANSPRPWVGGSECRCSSRSKLHKYIANGEVSNLRKKVRSQANALADKRIASVHSRNANAAILGGGLFPSWARA